MRSSLNAINEDKILRKLHEGAPFGVTGEHRCDCSICLLAFKGLNLGIDFSGGVLFRWKPMKSLPSAMYVRRLKRLAGASDTGL